MNEQRVGSYIEIYSDVICPWCLHREAAAGTGPESTGCGEATYHLAAVSVESDDAEGRHGPYDLS